MSRNCLAEHYLDLFCTLLRHFGHFGQLLNFLLRSFTFDPTSWHSPLPSMEIAVRQGHSTGRHTTGIEGAKPSSIEITRYFFAYYPLSYPGWLDSVMWCDWMVGKVEVSKQNNEWSPGLDRGLNIIKNWKIITGPGWTWGLINEFCFCDWWNSKESNWPICTGFISHLICAFYRLQSLASIDEFEWL